MAQKLLLLALAGGLGTLSRFALTGFVHRVNGVSFPWGTMTVNLAGCLLTGFLWSLFESRWPVSGETRTIVFLGFMGAFTTFSTFIFESGEMLRTSEWMHAALNLGLQNGFGLAALFAGMAIGRMI